MHKIIHYCWFGNNPKSELIEMCISSWQKYASNYEIKEWNESNFDVKICPYVEEAYKYKKWAFVSDYARFWILYNHGGIYVDTDVEFIKNIETLPDCFVGFENLTTCNSGLIRAANKGDIICEEMLKSYDKDHFINSDGTLNLQTVCERETKILKKYGLIQNGQRQFVQGTSIFPKEYFCPMDIYTNKVEITPNTYAIHHYAASWVKDKESLRGKVYRLIYRIFGEKNANKIRKCLKKKKR